MKHLSMVARIITPAAMVVFLSHELSRSLAVSGWWAAFLLIGSVATAAGIEIVGILAGHTLEGYWRLGDTWRSFLALVLLAVYTAAAVYILRGNPVLSVVPVVAAIVYVLAALSDGLHTAVIRQEGEAAASQDYDQERRRADDDHRRRMEAAELRLKHDERLARIKARANTVPAQPAQPAQRANGTAVVQLHSEHECQDCTRSFATVQALNAHGRFCAARYPERANGKVKEQPQ